MTKHKHEHRDPEVPQNLDLSSEQDDLASLLEKDFPREAAVIRQYGMDRRTFMKLMGASMAMAGFGVGCVASPPDEDIVPYVRMPEEIVPGTPLFFASAMTLGGYATGVVIETHEGRPTRIDGNPRHPASLGASNAYVQGSILELYNPDRSTGVLQAGVLRSWETFLMDLAPIMENASGVAILTETVVSPTLASQLAALQEQMPGASWYQYEPVNRDTVNAGAELAFDQIVNTVYHFEQADVVVSLDANFLADMPGSLRYTREFAARRKVRGTDADDVNMNRLYMVESSPTITGAMADNRLSLRAGDVEGFTRALAAALGVEGIPQPNNTRWETAWLETLVNDLQANTGRCVVVPGNEQPPVVHALAHAINAQLEAVGVTVNYTEPIEANPVNQVEDLAALVQEIENRNVGILLIIGGNPAFTAPADIPFAEVLPTVPISMHLSLYNDETSKLCTWHLPQTHFVEEWTDARAFDGTLAIVQPPIGPLYESVHSAHDVLAAMMGDERSSYEIVRDYWQSQYNGDDFEAFWRQTAHDGFAQNTAAEPLDGLSLRGDFVSQIAAIDVNDGFAGLELIFRADPTIFDGRFASNSWLQELPSPITNLTWDNAALVHPDTADDLGVEDEDLVELSFGGNRLEVPILTAPGHAKDAVTIFLGYGRGLSAELEEDQNFNAYRLRTSDRMWFGGELAVDNRDEKYRLATIRAEFDADALESQYSDYPVRSGTLQDFISNPEFVHLGDKQVEVVSAYDDVDYSEGYSWGMTIDLSACVGCNACIIACQSENNIPAVGKESVMKSREMHWLRVDRYYEEVDGDLKTSFQPVPCMHCETAPCEQVCPVQATIHDTEGLNTMVYNRCIGTRYCSANCPYNVRRFNFEKYVDEADILVEQRNPNVSVRPEGVMEKCTYCTQRISAARIQAKNEDREIFDGEVMPACASACPAQAIQFGNLNDPNAVVVQEKTQPHHYGVLEELGTKPRTTYLARLSNPTEA